METRFAGFYAFFAQEKGADSSVWAASLQQLQSA